MRHTIDFYARARARCHVCLCVWLLLLLWLYTARVFYKGDLELVTFVRHKKPALSIFILYYVF